MAESGGTRSGQGVNLDDAGATRPTDAADQPGGNVVLLANRVADQAIRALRRGRPG